MIKIAYKKTSDYLINIDFAALEKVTIGSGIYFGDGEINARIIDNNNGAIEAVVINNGILTNNMAMGIVMRFNIPSEEIKFINMLLSKYSFSILLSFVCSKQNIIWAKNTFINANKVVPKIETLEAVDCFEDILGVTDYIFIGRGDLGLSIGVEKIGIVQRNLINQAKKRNVKIALGTGTLESLHTSATPYRAEIVDITNSYLSGVDYIVLTSETAGSERPFDSMDWIVKVLNYLNLVVK